MGRLFGKARQLAMAAVAAAFMLAAATACSDDPQPVSPPKPAERTLLMLLPWEESLFNSFNRNVRELSECITRNGLDAQNVVVYLALPDNTSQLLRLYATPDGCMMSLLKEYQEQKTQTADDIARILNDVKALAPAPQYSMVIGGHGSAWLPADTPLPNYAPAKFGMPADPRRKAADTRYFGGTTEGHKTEVATLVEALRQAGMKLEYLLFDLCLMSNIEALYDLRGSADYLIACPTEILGRGMPYNEMGKAMLGTPDYKGIVESFHRFYSSYSTPCGTICVTKTDELDSLAKVTRKINMTCSQACDAMLLQRYDGLGNTLFYDLGDYVRRSCTDADALREFEAQLERATPFKAHTQSFYTGSGRSYPIRTYSGLSTSEPSRNSVAPKVKETAWHRYVGGR